MKVGQWKIDEEREKKLFLSRIPFFHYKHQFSEER